ncbi:unnamed protein product [Diamesa serratosioi]
MMEDYIKDKDVASKVNSVSQCISKLCRICSSTGLININTVQHPRMLSVKPSTDVQKWDVPIKTMISEISNEEVFSDDGLPQHVCTHCLYYLHHAYELRLKIQNTSSSLKETLKIATENSIQLEETKINQQNITIQELELSDEENSEEMHFYNLFKDADLKISLPKKMQIQDRLVEHKCESCKQRVLSIKSLKEHENNCMIHCLDTFYSAVYQLYSQRITEKISFQEYTLRAMKLISEVQKKLDKFAKDKKIDLEAICDEPIKIMTEARVKIETPKRYFSSPGTNFTIKYETPKRFLTSPGALLPNRRESLNSFFTSPVTTSSVQQETPNRFFTSPIMTLPVQVETPKRFNVSPVVIMSNKSNNINDGRPIRGRWSSSPDNGYYSNNP